MRRAQGPPEVVLVDGASPESSFRELDDVFLQTQTKVWLGEVLHLRFDEDILAADLLADGELLFQVSKVIWRMLLKKNKEQLKQSKVHIYERTSSGKSNGKYMPYPKVDSFFKICQILGLAGIDLFTPSDVVEKRNARKVCICIRLLSKKARMMHLNVPDFDIVTYTIAMPNYIVGGIRRNLEQSQCSSSGSSGYSPRATPRALNQQRIFGEHNDQNDDTHYDSDEAESRLFVIEPEDSADEDSFPILLQSSDAPQEEREDYGKSGHEMYHKEKSPFESVGSHHFGIIDDGSVDSASFMCEKESHYPTQSLADRCSRNSELIFPEKDFAEETSSCRGSCSDLVDHVPDSGTNFLQAGSEIPADALACDRESVGSTSGELKFGLIGVPSDLTTSYTMESKLPAVSEDTMNVSLETSSLLTDGEDRCLPETENHSASRGLKPESSTKNQTDAAQFEDKPVTSEDSTAKISIAQGTANAAPKSGKGVLKSVAGGITLVGAVFLVLHLRRKARNFATIIPSMSEKSVQNESRAKNVDKGKAATVYPGEWLKV